jgi:hypothetical protein
MPTGESILSWATSVTNEWRWLAVGWHVALAALSIALLRGFRPSGRTAGLLLVLPPYCVSALAFVTGNPFNGVTFAVLATLLLRTSMKLPETALPRASIGWVLAGAALVAFGWTYPHFLRSDSVIAYAVASPFGLLPCPTLAVVIGMTVVLGGLQSFTWSLLLCAAGVLYGAIGVIALGVALDVWLLAGAVLLGVMAVTDLKDAGRDRAGLLTNRADAIVVRHKSHIARDCCRPSLESSACPTSPHRSRRLRQSLSYHRVPKR